MCPIYREAPTRKSHTMAEFNFVSTEENTELLNFRFFWGLVFFFPMDYLYFVCLLLLRDYEKLSFSCRSPGE